MGQKTWGFAGGGEEAGLAMESAMKENMKSCKMATWVVSMAVTSMVGGVVFGWWEFRFHPTNRQLWMVPFGLILMTTPMFVIMSLLISAFMDQPISMTSMDQNQNQNTTAIQKSVQIG